MIRVIELSNPEVFKLIDKLCIQEVSLNTAMQLNNLRAQIADSIELYESKRIDLLRQHGKKDSEGKLLLAEGNVQFDDEGQIAFANEIEKIANTPFEKISLSKDGLNDLKLSANDLRLLFSLVEIR